MMFYSLYGLATLFIVFNTSVLIHKYLAQSSKRKKKSMKKSLLSRLTFLAFFFIWPLYLFDVITLTTLSWVGVFVMLFYTTIHFVYGKSRIQGLFHVLRTGLSYIGIGFILYLYFSILHPALLSVLVFGFLTIVLILLDRLHPWILRRFFRVVPYYYREELSFLNDMHIAKTTFMIEVRELKNMRNAMVVGVFRPYQLYLFKGMLESMNHREIIGIISHEAGHIKHKHLIVRMVLAVLALCSFIAAGTLIIQSEDGVLLSYTTLVVAFIILGYLYRSIFALILQKQEFQADAYARDVGYGEALISALNKLKKGEGKIYNPLLHKLSATHPVTDERITRLTSEN